MTTDNTCNGWRNAATWTVNLWFGDSWGEMQSQGVTMSAMECRDDVEQYVEDMIGQSSSKPGFLWDMLDLNTVDWATLAAHHAPETDWIET
jgi:hypothetical protein